MTTSMCGSPFDKFPGEAIFRIEGKQHPQNGYRETTLVSGPVVVGSDGSAPSDLALEVAYEIAQLSAVPLRIVHLREDGLRLMAASTLDPRLRPGYEACTEARSNVRLDRIAELSRKFPDVVTEQSSPTGFAAGQLIRAASGERGRAALIVVGARGWDGFEGLSLGSTCQALLAHAPCAVKVVREWDGQS